jgi:hypothetical protein
MTRRPVVQVDEDAQSIRVRVSTGSAEVWVRVTPGGRRMQVAIEEGDGTVDVEWSIRMANGRQATTSGPFVQSPVSPHVGRPDR